MLTKAEVFGVQLNKRWEYQGRSGETHRIHVVWCDEMPRSNTDVGRKCETLKVPSSVNCNGISPGDFINVDFDRWGRPVYIALTEA